jgi:hypothetical protein
LLQRLIPRNQSRRSPMSWHIFNLRARIPRSIKGLLWSAPGLRRVKTALGMSAPAARAQLVFSGRDCSDQRLDPDNVHDPCQIVGQN